ncbi:hypothetical protein ACNKHU_16305 [Shigella flexneri]
MAKLAGNPEAVQHAADSFINQIRMKIALMSGNPETTTGGNVLKFSTPLFVSTSVLFGAVKGRKRGGKRNPRKRKKNKSRCAV